LRHIILDARRQQLRLVDLPGAIVFAHTPGQNPTRTGKSTDYSDRLLAGLQMACFEMNVPLSTVAWVMALQGFGVGWLWVPMTLVTFSNLDPRRSAEGASLFHFVRSVGSSYFISASVVVVFHTQKMNYGELVQWINPFSAPLKLQSAVGGWSAESTTGLAQIAGEVARQATNIGYINAFNLYLWTSLLIYPLIAMISWPPTGYRPASPTPSGRQR
ncbi:MAG: hypothetical protein SFW09_23335, partial [Hyphomicrobiaceae bacterium]|nr:hypothetical protein [Hyphomicrobiaceae bacterium]